MKKTPRAEVLNIDLYWDADCLQGVALGAVDVLRMINQLHAMRVGHAATAVAWRWRALPDEAAPPRGLPRGPRCWARTADVALVPGWHVQSGPQLERLVRRSAGVIPALQAVHAAGGQLGFVYSAVALGAQAGCFDGARAVAPWPFVMATLRHARQMQIAPEASWTSGNRVWSSNSPAWLIPMLLDMLRQSAKPSLAELADSVANVLLPSPQRQAGALTVQGRKPGASLPEGVVPRARRWLEAHLGRPYDLQALAEAAATSPRTLLRHFAQAYGCTPLQHLQQLRVARAQVLLETSYVSIAQIARMCGFPDPGTFRRVFVQLVGKRPSDYRAHLRLRTSRKRWGEDVVTQEEAGL